VATLISRLALVARILEQPPFGVALSLRLPLRVGQGVGKWPCEAACVTSSLPSSQILLSTPWSALLHGGEERPRHAPSREARPLRHPENPNNWTSEGLSHGFWASEWSRSGEPIAQCNSAPGTCRQGRPHRSTAG
jgi:hypothetical protein